MTRAKDISKILTDADISGTLDVTGTTTGTNITATGSISSTDGGTALTLGVLSNATTLPALNFNGAFASSAMTGLYGNGVTASNLYYTVPSSKEHIFSIADSQKMVLSSSGNLGIGTSSPNSKLTSQTATSSTSAFSFANQLNNSTSSNNSIVALGFHNRADVNADGVGGAIALSGGGNGGGSGNLIFCIKDTSDIANTVAPSDEKMRIDASGNLLVGATSSNAGAFGAISPQILVAGTIPQVALHETDTDKDGYIGISSSTMFIQTADAIPIRFGTSDAERVRIMSSGEVGIGESNPAQYFSSANQLVIRDGTANAGLTIRTGSSGAGTIAFADGATTALQQYNGYIEYTHGTNALAFATEASERMRIDASGNLLHSTTSTLNMGANDAEGTSLLAGGVLRISANGQSSIHAGRQSNFGSVMTFACMGTSDVGSIDVTTTATSYTTSSDYRLKESVTYDFDATTRLKQLKPCRFNFITDADTTVDGFLAHEVQSVVPEAISGEKDAVDADGNAVMQGIDQSKIVPLLVKTIQELEARITTLEGA